MKTEYISCRNIIHRIQDHELVTLHILPIQQKAFAKKMDANPGCSVRISVFPNTIIRPANHVDEGNEMKIEHAVFAFGLRMLNSLVS